MNTLDVVYIASVFYVLWSIVKILHFLYYIICNFKTIFQVILNFLKKVLLFFKRTLNSLRKTKYEKNITTYTHDELPFSRYNLEKYEFKNINQ
jgi:hypothetical protein